MYSNILKLYVKSEVQELKVSRGRYHSLLRFRARTARLQTLHFSELYAPKYVRVNTMHNVQKTTNFIVLYVQCIHNYMFRPILGHLQVVSYSLESEVS